MLIRSYIWTFIGRKFWLFKVQTDFSYEWSKLDRAFPDCIRFLVLQRKNLKQSSNISHGCHLLDKQIYIYLMMTQKIFPVRNVFLSILRWAMMYNGWLVYLVESFGSPAAAARSLTSHLVRRWRHWYLEHEADSYQRVLICVCEHKAPTRAHLVPI